MVGDYTEDSLVEQPAIALFEELGWETANCFYESFKDSPSPVSSPKGRGINIGWETPYDVVLEPKLRAAFRNPFRIHPHLYPLPKGEEAGVAGGAINVAVKELTKNQGVPLVIPKRQLPT